MNGWKVIDRNPAFTNQALVSDVHVEQVHCVINRFHLLNHDGPTWKFLGNIVQDTLTMILRLIQNHVQILQTCQDALQHFIALFWCVGARIQIGMVTGADFLDATFQLITLEESNKDGFVKLVTLKRTKSVKITLQIM